MENKIQTLLRKAKEQYSETERSLDPILDHFSQYKTKVEETRKAIEFDLNQVVETAYGIWEWLKSLNLDGTDFYISSFLESNQTQRYTCIADLNGIASRGIIINRGRKGFYECEGEVRLNYPLIPAEDFKITYDGTGRGYVFLNPRGLLHNVNLTYPDKGKNRFSFRIYNPKEKYNPAKDRYNTAGGLDLAIEDLIDQYLAKTSSERKSLNSLHKNIKKWMDELGELKRKIIENLSIKVQGPKDDKRMFTMEAFVECGKEYFMQQVEKFIELTTAGY